MAGCAYGEVYEPDPPAGSRLASGWENAARPLVVAPQFPVPEHAHVGLRFAVTVTFLGRVAARHAELFWESVRIGGADLGLGLGEDHIPFDVEPGTDEPGEVHLPLDAKEAPGTIASVQVELTSPLFLSVERERGQKQLLTRPSFADLLRAGLRVLGPVHKLYAVALPEDVFARVKEAAMRVGTIEANYHEFRQGKWSNRTKARFDMHGIHGTARYGPVSTWLLPWLTWAGRLHVGTHRVAGAGGWFVKTS
jgi:hypothetical protein